jgi:3'-5' exoribonuclease
MDPDAMFAQIRALVAQVRDGHVRALLESFLDDPELAPAFRRAPAAKSIHHAFVGGLCEHTLSVMQLGWRICDHYPQLDRDLVTAGCLLHDFGKSREISPEPGFEYTDEGKLVGHLVLTCQLIREKAARIEGFPRELEWRITHIVVAHHGRLEYGSPKEPVTLEAMAVHALDELDTRVSSFGQLLAAASEGRWTDKKNLYGRQLLKSGTPQDDARRFAGPGIYREGK